METPGYNPWTACQALSKPLTILGAERRLAICNGAFCAAWLNISGALAACLGLMVAVHLLLVWITRQDPAYISALREATARPARLDPGKPPASPAIVME